MGLSYDSASSILLCAEDNNSILCFEDEVEGENGHGWAQQQQRSGLYGDFLMGFPLQTDECLDLMVKREAEHLPRDDYGKRLITGALDISIRRDAIDWIWKVRVFSFFLSFLFPPYYFPLWQNALIGFWVNAIILSLAFHVL